MLKQIALLLIIFLGSQGLALELVQDRTWSGQISLNEDIVVPLGKTLTIAPGTQVETNGNKIIAYGQVNILGQTDQEITFHNTLMTLNSTIEVVRVKPYDIDTKILKDEFAVFKIQYAILWSLLFASTFVLLEAR
jgi:hypothetical protein